MSSKLTLCPNCKGKGKVITQAGPYQLSNKCEKCNGTGKVPAKK